MHRIDTATAQKDKFGAGKNGFTRGNPQTGTPATDLDDDYCDMLQEELAGVVEASGATLDKEKHNQLLTALGALLLSRKNPFADIKADGAAAVAEALSNLGFQSGTTSTGGWIRLQNGFLFQWGRIDSAAAGGGTDVYFPTPYIGIPAYTFGVTASSCVVYICEGASQTKLNKVRAVDYTNSMATNAGYFMAGGF